MTTTTCTKQQYEDLQHTRWVSTARFDLKIDSIRKTVGIKERVGGYSVMGFHTKEALTSAVIRLIQS